MKMQSSVQTDWWERRPLDLDADVRVPFQYMLRHALLLVAASGAACAGGLVHWSFWIPAGGLFVAELGFVLITLPTYMAPWKPDRDPLSVREQRTPVDKAQKAHNVRIELTRGKNVRYAQFSLTRPEAMQQFHRLCRAVQARRENFSGRAAARFGLAADWPGIEHEFIERGLLEEKVKARKTPKLTDAGESTIRSFVRNPPEEV